MSKSPGRIKLSAFVPGPETVPAVAAPPQAAPIAPAAPPPAAPVEPDAPLMRAPSKLERTVGVTPFVTFLSPKDKRRLKILAAETGLSFQDIGIEALSMFLRARGLPPLERVKASVPDGRKKR